MTEDNDNVFIHIRAANSLAEMQEDIAMTSSSSLSDDQQKVLGLWMIVAGCLSVIGSFFTMYRVFKSSSKTNSYDRIIFGLSGFNMLSAITYIMTPFLLPSDGPSSRIWSNGNQVSCSFLGWLTQLSFASVSYTFALSFYFVAMIKFRIHMDEFAIRFEAYIHGLTIFFFLFTATAGVPLQMYDQSEIGMSCWIRDDFPNKCIVGEDCIGNQIGWFFGGWIVCATLLLLVVNHVLVWWQIRRKLAGVRKGVETPTWAIRIRRSRNQALLYVLAFYLTNSTPIVLRILEQSYGYTASREHELYQFLVIHSFLVPLQGFLNTFIHARPNYLKLRANDYPISMCFWLAAWYNRIDEYVEGPAGESNLASSGDGSRSKEDQMLSRLENSIRMMSEVITEELSNEESTEWSLQALRKLSMTLPNSHNTTGKQQQQRQQHHQLT
ncbi:unnamed protein product [Cylindrotheca closterium]|uniref:G-protein coupled receptors family 2 profile 2 domain-containing protein n=1 Tax=Cylindrotheca closterium TaxID=2856 RepID=A0AAD2CMZ6_9STRA|nr:unnamed protein product [Cylindrotheca closterium]